MIGLWVDLPWWVRTPISLAMMAFGIYLLWDAGSTKDALDFGGGMIQRRNFFFGVVLVLTGLLLLALGSRSNSEKNGYKF